MAEIEYRGETGSRGNLEPQLFAYAQMQKLRALRTRDLTGPLSISGKQERKLLNRLAKAGMIAQVRRRFYLWSRFNSLPRLAPAHARLDAKHDHPSRPAFEFGATLQRRDQPAA